MKVNQISSKRRNGIVFQHKIPTKFRPPSLENKFLDSIMFSDSYFTRVAKEIYDKGIQIVSATPIKLQKNEVIELISKIVEANEHAQKNVLTGNTTNVGYASCIKLKNGGWQAPTTNFAATRGDPAIFCGERSGIVTGFNNWLKSLKLKKLKNNTAYRIKNNQDEAFKVSYFAMSSHKPLGTDKNAASPCADCLSWLDTERFFNDETKVATLLENGSGKMDLIIRSIREYLPYRHEKSSILTINKSIKELEINYSSKASKSIIKNSISKNEITDLIEKAKETHDKNVFANISMQNVAASVLSNAKEIFSARKIDWSKRWHLEPGEFAIGKLLESNGEKTQVKAVAYYGKGEYKDPLKNITYKDGVVSIQTLGRIKGTYGSPETLVVTIQNNNITVRTIGDYMNEDFAFVQDYSCKKAS